MAGVIKGEDLGLKSHAGPGFEILAAVLRVADRGLRVTSGLTRFKKVAGVCMKSTSASQCI